MLAKIGEELEQWVDYSHIGIGFWITRPRKSSFKPRPAAAREPWDAVWTWTAMSWDALRAPGRWPW